MFHFPAIRPPLSGTPFSMLCPFVAAVLHRYRRDMRITAQRIAISGSGTWLAFHLEDKYFFRLPITTSNFRSSLAAGFAKYSAGCRSTLRCDGPRFAIGRFCNLSTCRPMFNETFVSDRISIPNIPSSSVGREQRKTYAANFNY
jgi:hypothetical protein